MHSCLDTCVFVPQSNHADNRVPYVEGPAGFRYEISDFFCVVGLFLPRVLFWVCTLSVLSSANLALSLFALSGCCKNTRPAVCTKLDAYRTLDWWQGWDQNDWFQFRGVVQNFHWESTEFSSRGFKFIKKLVPGETNFVGPFYHYVSLDLN